MIPAALDVMRQAVAYPPPPKNSFTTNEYAERYGISAKSAARQLAGLVKTCKLKTVVALLKSRVVRVYWIP